MQVVTHALAANYLTSLDDIIGFCVEGQTNKQNIINTASEDMFPCICYFWCLNLNFNLSIAIVNTDLFELRCKLLI